MNRRKWIASVCESPVSRLTSKAFAQGLTPLDVAYAGSMGSMMEGPIKDAVAKTLGIDMHGRAQGSDALAQLIVGGSIPADVFIPVTPGPMMTVLKAGKALHAVPIARTEMVIAYSPKSAFAQNFSPTRISPARCRGMQFCSSRGYASGAPIPLPIRRGATSSSPCSSPKHITSKPGLAQKILGGNQSPRRYSPNRRSKRVCRAASSTLPRPTRFNPARSACRSSNCRDEINLGNNRCTRPIKARRWI